MIIALLNCMPGEEYAPVEKELDLFIKGDTKNTYDVITVRDMDIKYCCGCWSCWVKTPGLCIQRDEMPRILRKILKSDLTVFISPIIMGFVSSLQKKINDKMLPIVHPYIKICNNECHHRARYDKYPKMGLLLIKNDSSQSEDVLNISEIYRRFAINMKTELLFSVSTKGSLEGFKNEVNSI